MAGNIVGVWAGWGALAKNWTVSRDSMEGVQSPSLSPALAEPETGVTLKLTERYSLLNLLQTLHWKFGNISDCQRFFIWYKKLQRNIAAQIWQPTEGFLINFKRSA